MQAILLVIHLIIALALVGLVLMQRSEGGALGIGGGGGGAGGLMTARGAANLLTRATSYLAVAFLATSLGLALLAQSNTEDASVLDQDPSLLEKQVDETPAPPIDQ